MARLFLSGESGMCPCSLLRLPLSLLCTIDMIETGVIPRDFKIYLAIEMKLNKA